MDNLTPVDDPTDWCPYWTFSLTTALLCGPLTCLSPQTKSSDGRLGSAIRFYITCHYIITHPGQVFCNNITTCFIGCRYLSSNEILYHGVICELGDARGPLGICENFPVVAWLTRPYRARLDKLDNAIHELH